MVNDPDNGERTTRQDSERQKAEAKRRCNICGGLFKNERGVKIHQGKSRCKEQRQQRSAPELTQSNLSGFVRVARQSVEEDQDQETNHSALDLPAQPTQSTGRVGEPESPKDFERKPRLNLPPANDLRWAQLDKDLDVILDNTLKGDAAKKISAMVEVVYQVCYDTFGVKEGKNLRPPAGPSRRQRQIKALRDELKTLKKRWQEASEAEKTALNEISSELRKKIIQLRRAEIAREKQRERRRKRKAFFNNPFQFTAVLLGKPKGGTLTCTKEEVEDSVAAAHSDPSRNVPLGDCPFTLPTITPDTPFNMGDFTMDEVKAVVTKARAASAPGPSGTTYKIYKCCPRLLKRLSKLLRTLWKKKLEPGLWTLAEGCFVPKEANSTTLEQFREISLLDVEGKIFWSIVGKRLTTYLIANNFIDPTVQKGGVPGYSGCLEHTSAISQLINEAKSKHNTLSVVWLDLAKAYPSIPHQLIRKALEYYCIPPEVVKLVMSHMSTLRMRFTVGSITTKWQKLEKGIMAGCTISVVLFIAAMNLLLKAGQTQCRGPKAEDGTRHPACRAFMDDVTVMTPSIHGTQWILDALDKMASWSRLQFKSEKSRSLSIVKGKLTQNIFTIQGSEIPRIQDQKIRCLGKFYDSSLNDSSNLTATRTQLTIWLKAIEQSQLLGRFKVWCFQYGIIPRLQWPFLLYDFPMSQVEAMERLCSRFLRKWLGVPPSFSAVNLYCRTSKLSLPISSVVEEFQATKARAVSTLRSSEDRKVRHASKTIKCGRKWKPQQAVTEAESHWKHQEIVGVVCKGRLGLGHYSKARWSRATARARRTLVVQRVREAAEEDRQVKAIGLASQGRWTQWDQVEERPLSWKELWQFDQGKLSFLLRSVTDLLPTPNNLKIWGSEEDPSCTQCGTASCTLNHILAGCPKALAEGRYRWRHDKVLTEIANFVEQQRVNANKGQAQLLKAIPFVKEGEKAHRKSNVGKNPPSILQNASDWELSVDLKKRLIFPQDVAVSPLRPDMVLLSRSTKTIIIAELTVPWEERLDVSHQLKKAKYQDLVDEATLKGWHATIFPIEVGCRGFPAKSVRYFLQRVGLEPKRLKKATRDIAAAAESSSRWLWLKRAQSWNPSAGEA